MQIYAFFSFFSHFQYFYVILQPENIDNKNKNDNKYERDSYFGGSDYAVDKQRNGAKQGG